MQVQDQLEVAIFGELLDELLRVVDGIVVLLRNRDCECYTMRIVPDPVQVDAVEVAAVVAVHDTVRVEVGDHVEDEEVPQDLGLGGVAQEEVQDPLHHDGAWRLTRVLPCHDNNTHFLVIT